MIPYTEYQEKMLKEHEDLNNKSGIYGIYCNDTLVYIGKSKDILRRAIEHQKKIRKPDEPKYTCLKLLKQNGYKLSLRVILLCPEEELKTNEYRLIAEKQPELNTVGTEPVNVSEFVLKWGIFR